MKINFAHRQIGNTGFTLFEVMVASFIFFTAIFAILEIVSQGLRSARLIQQTFPDASGLAAEFALTNKLEEGVEQGDFGDLHPEYTWSREVMQVATNGLFEVRYTIYRGATEDSTMSLLLFRPESQPPGVFRR
jgi:Tfp pilus assembly protein PilV